MLRSHQEEVVSFLAQIGQKQLGVGLENLTHDQEETFLKQLTGFGPHLLERQRHALFHTEPPTDFEPLNQYDTAGNEVDASEGWKRECGCIILAGGQGTRLGSLLPKGLVPVSLVKNKSLLQIFCEKGVAASKRRGRPVSIAIMTSPLNDQIIRSYLEHHHYFGLSETQVDLFSQQLLPFLDNGGNWLLEAPGKIGAGPDGNGHTLKLFFETGIWAKWKEKGVECLNIVNVDNPLADPFDAELIGYHSRRKNDMTVKAIVRDDSEEKMGVVGLKEGKIGIREYTEISEKDCYPLANTGLFCLDIDFIKRCAEFSFPWHFARKKSPVLLGTSKGYCQELAMVWKFETFIFDILDRAANSSVLVYPRETTYAPLKNATGDKSLATVQAALLAADKAIFSKLTGMPPPEKPFELDQAFYYPTEELIDKWSRKVVSENDYIDAEL